MNPSFDIQDNVLVKYTGGDAEVVIPQGITVIGKKAFEGSSITSVIMPDSVVKIESNAFTKCAKLKTVEFSNCLEEIGYEAFARCKGLKALTLPDTLRIVGGGAFGGCEKLSSIQCSSVVYEAGSNPFSTYDTKVPPAMFNKDGFLIFLNVLYEYIGNAKEVVVPQGVTHIAGGVFRSGTYSWEKKLEMESIVLPDSLQSIGANGFANCTSLRSIQMPRDVQLGDDVFLGCSGLADENGFFLHSGKLLAYCGSSDTVIVPPGTKSIGNKVFANVYGSNTGNKNIHTVVLPEGLESIGISAFADCDLLERIEIPETVRAIGDGAFAGCDHLAAVTIPTQLETMGNGVFKGCKKLADDQGFLIFNGVLQGYFSSERHVVVPEGVTAISRGCFEKTAIVSIALPSTLRRLEAAFRGCDMLEQIRIPEGITQIPYGCFLECTRLTKVQLPSTLKAIHGSAFAGCTALTEILLPAGLERIDSSAFENCSSLLSVQIPEGIRELASSLFCKCVSLRQVTLPQSLTKIGSLCFRGCTALEAVVLPRDLEVIGYGSFTGCTALKTVDSGHFRGELAIDAFNDCPNLADKNGFVIIGSSLLRYDGPGGNVVVPEGITILTENVFREGSVYRFRNYRTFRKEGSLKTITLPSTLKVIGSGALGGCPNLKTITIPEGVTVLGEDAFMGSGLQTLRLPESIQEMGDGVFRECAKLTQVTLPESLRTLSKEMFHSCAALAEITLPAGLETVGDDAFRGCGSLQNIHVAQENPHFASLDGMLTDKTGKHILWCPGGRKLTSYEIPQGITAIGRHGFIDCTALQKIVIPASVKDIGDEAFPRRGWNHNNGLKIIEADPAAGGGTIGENIFDIGTWGNEVLTFPKLPPHLVKEQAVQLLLCLGYCMEPDKYQGEYARIYKKLVTAREKSLLKKADAMSLTKVREYFAANTDSTAKKTTINYKKLSPQGKVEALEAAIVSRDAAKVREVIAGCGSFEFTARALGIACLHSTPEIVKLLVENGADFAYTCNSTLKRKYGAAFTTTYSQYPADYSALIVKTGVHVYNPVLYADTLDYHFGDLPRIDAPVSSIQERLETARYLLTVPQAHFNASQAMSYGILWGDQELAQMLHQQGTQLCGAAILGLADTAASIDRSEFTLTLGVLSPKQCLAALTTFCQLLAERGRKIILPQRAFEEKDTSLLDPEVLRFVFANTDTGKLTKSKLLEAAIDSESIQAIAVLVEAGGIKNSAQREKAITYAMNRKKTEALAWLMDYKNKTADLAAEAARADAKILRELTEDPNSVSAMKRIWGYKKLEDGTLHITGYKGCDEVVEVPAKIGKATVTVIGEEAFCGSDYGRNKNWEARRKIRHIILPDTIRQVGERAFFLCQSLEKLDFPETLNAFGDNAFGRCDKLRDAQGLLVLHNTLFDCVLPNGHGKELVIPEGITAIGPKALHPRWSSDSINTLESIILPESLVTIGEGAFEDLKKLRRIRIPGSVRTIGKRAFYGCPLVEVTLSEGLKKILPMAFANTPLPQLTLPKSLESLGDQCLYGCRMLRDLYIPATVTHFGNEVLGAYGESSEHSWLTYHPSGVYVYTPQGSAAVEYMQQYPGVYVSHEYPQE